MKGFALVLLCLIDVFPSCGKRNRPVVAPAYVGTAERPRSIDVTVSNLGYRPASISGRPAETLRLVFHYESSAGECGREVVLPQKNVRLTLKEQQPAEVTLTLPAARGEVVEWSCGMNMLHGKILVD